MERRDELITGSGGVWMMRPPATPSGTIVEVARAQEPPRGLDGVVERVTRVLSEADWRLVRSFVSRMDRNDLRLRFGNPVNLDANDALLRRLLGTDPVRGEIGLSLDGPATIAGMSHRVLISPSEAEVALVVRSDIKRRGVGARMLQALIGRSVNERLTRLSGTVLRENRPMIQLALKFGAVVRERDGPSVTFEFLLDSALP